MALGLLVPGQVALVMIAQVACDALEGIASLGSLADMLARLVVGKGNERSQNQNQNQNQKTKKNPTYINHDGLVASLTESANSSDRAPIELDR
jgi:hypothetical protein